MVTSRTMKHVQINCTYFQSDSTTSIAPCGLLGCKNGPAPFHGRIKYKVTKPGLVCLSYLCMIFIILLFIRVPVYVLLVFVGMFSVFLVVLVKLSVLAK